MLTDYLEAAAVRFGGGSRLYAGQIETCTRVQHAGVVRRGDELPDAAFLEDVLHRKDATCFPPYMHGLGYVLAAPLVRVLGAMAAGGAMRVYANDDVMVGIWLLGHRVDRARLVAKEYLDMWYQTSLSQCFPFYMNQRVPSNEHYECAHFYASTGLCFAPRIGAIAPPTVSTSASASLLQALRPPDGAAASAASQSATQATLAQMLNSATAANARLPATDAATLSKLRHLVTVGIKVVTKLRNHVHFILHSLHVRYPGVRVIVADDEYIGVGGEEWRRMRELMRDYNVTYVQAVPRSGLSAGRNALVDHCATEYLVLLDDDVFFSASTKLEALLAQLEANPSVAIAAGAYAQYSSKDASMYVHDYSLRFGKSTTEEGAWYAYTPQPPVPGQCYPVHGAHNFFMARTDALRKYTWHPKMSIFEHEHFFFQLYLANQSVLSCPHVSIFHYRAPNLHDEKYMSSSLRFKEAAYARHFCHAFPQVRRLYAPFWTYDCVRFQLCPRFQNGGACRPMADPYNIVRGAVGLGKLGGITPALPSAGDNDVKTAAAKGGKGAVAASNDDGPQPVLLLGEGAAMEVVSKIFVDSAQYMLWREPRTWKVVSHLPDELYATTLAALLKCELSAQQLLILHSEAPDYDPQAETKGSGLLSGAPPVTLAEKEHVEWLQTLYAERRRWRPGDKRFCAPNVATAALVSRFAGGVPRSLMELPIKVLALVRHPSDVVIERLQAKPIKGMAAYPECSIATIGQCADELCGSMMRMLDDLQPAAKADRLKLVMWESLIKRRHRSSAELQGWISMGDAANASEIATKLADGISAQQTAFNTLAKSYPISLQSLRLVEQRCAPLMKRLGYKPTADAAASDATSGSSKGRRHAKRFSGKKKKKGQQQAAEEAGGDATAAPTEPLLLLRRRTSAVGGAKGGGGGAAAKGGGGGVPLMWCPVRLTGTEALARLFVGLDVPRATRAPPCFPGSKDDICPVPRSAAWMPSRWGPYPFEVLEPSLGDAAGGKQPILGGFSFAIVRNPWARLASAYAKLIAVEDQRTSVHRTWIREMHNLNEKDSIRFSHFIRWVVAQEPASMHRAWRPYSRTCRFRDVKYDAILRFESLQSDVPELMERLGMQSDREKRVWQRANAETRPLMPPDSPDQLLKLHHLYFSDDERDLVQVVREKYREDIDLFGYSFPTNDSFAPWERVPGWRASSRSNP